MEKKEEITRKMIEQKMNELGVLLSKYEYDDSAELAEQICYEVARRAGYNLYESSGILARTQAVLQRAIDNMLMDAGNECECDDCKKKREDSENNGNSGKLN